MVQRNSRPQGGLLLLILLAAFVLRFMGTWYGLPSLYNSDEPFNVVNALAYGARQSLEPTYFVYPAFYSYILLAVYGLFFIVGRISGVFASALDFGAAYFIDPTGLFWVGRLLSVVLGVGAVWCVFKTGERFFSRRTGLLAAGALTFSFAHADVCHWILPEAAVTLMCALALYLILRFAQAPSTRANLLAGLVCGLAISTKYNAGFIALPFLLAGFQPYARERVQLVKHLALGLLSLLAGFLLGSPYWLLSFSSYWQDLQYSFSHVGAGMVGHIRSVPLVWPLFELVASDWGVGLLFVAGFFFVFFQRQKQEMVLLSFVLSTLLFVGLWSRSGVHYLAPLFPALALLAAVFIEQILRRIPNRAVQATLLLSLFLPPGVKIAVQDIRLAQTDTRTLAKEWIESNLALESMIAYENYVYGPNLYDPARFITHSAESQLLPLALKERLLEESLRRKTFRLVNLRKHLKLKVLAEADSTVSSRENAYVRQLLETRLPRLSALKRAGVPYIVASSDNYDRYFKSRPPEKGTALWLSYKNGRRFYDSLFKSKEVQLLKEFRPTFWRPGPTIRIYQFKSYVDDNGSQKHG